MDKSRPLLHRILWKRFADDGYGRRYPRLSHALWSLQHPRMTCEHCKRRVWMTPSRWNEAILWNGDLCIDCCRLLDRAYDVTVRRGE